MSPRLVLPILIAAMLIGCAGSSPEARHPKAEVPPMPHAEPLPTVSVRILTLRDWGGLAFFVSTEDVDLTLAEMVARGFPAELWVLLAKRSSDWRYVIYYVRPLRA